VVARTDRERKYHVLIEQGFVSVTATFAYSSAFHAGVKVLFRAGDAGGVSPAILLE
jgi:hypothetical protein